MTAFGRGVLDTLADVLTRHLGTLELELAIRVAAEGDRCDPLDLAVLRALTDDAAYLADLRAGADERTAVGLVIDELLDRLAKEMP